MTQPVAERARGRRLGRSAVSAEVVRFTTSSLVALVVLTLGTVLIAEQLAQRQALDDARARGAGIASRLAAPLVNRDLRRDPKASSENLDLVMGNRMADGSLRHVKLWDASGRILWADESDLVGRRFPLDEDVKSLFGTKRATAEVSDLNKAENVEERDEGQLLEVYAGAFDADGAPLVFEAYLPVNEIDRDARTIMVAFVPLLVGALVLFLAIVIPLAVSLSRRVERAQLERSKMMRHALLASDLERRRIATELHDGVIQELAGLGYVLPAARRELRPGGDLHTARSVVDRASAIIQHGTVMLRALMTDIYPPDLRDEGLREAVQQLVQTSALEGGFAADMAIEPMPDVSPEAGSLSYRVIREALRNVVKHADARHVVVELGQHAGQVLVRVKDDGRGPGPSPGDSPDGHLGLRLLRDAIKDFGGELDVQASNGSGTVLVARFPAAPVPF